MLQSGVLLRDLGGQRFCSDAHSGAEGAPASPPSDQNDSPDVIRAINLVTPNS